MVPLYRLGGRSVQISVSSVRPGPSTEVLHKDVETRDSIFQGAGDNGGCKFRQHSGMRQDPEHLFQQVVSMQVWLETLGFVAN